jgi:hypothetical protein
MREAAAPALPAVRSIAQISWREDMVIGPFGLFPRVVRSI